jgi:integrase/recombinase XerD
MNSYQSILGNEMSNFIQLRKTCGFSCKALITVLNNLDCFLCENNSIQKTLTEEFILKWMRSLSVKPYTLRCYLKDLSHFSKYLNSLGIDAFIPEKPKCQSDYTPYIFTEEEWIKIIEAADNLVIPRCPWSSIQIPLFVRLLYGCGLRVNEALNLLVEDIDTKKGVLLIRVAKKRKQRFVPMDSSLTFICKRYIRILQLNDSNYLFRNKRGERQNNDWADNCFQHILKKAEIVFYRGKSYERGPCMHCLRHTFVLRSLKKSADNGRTFDETVPFISTYLGHDSIRETDKYLNFNYELYEGAAQQVNAYTNEFFPEVML